MYTMEQTQFDAYANHWFKHQMESHLELLPLVKKCVDEPTDANYDLLKLELVKLFEPKIKICGVFDDTVLINSGIDYHHSSIGYLLYIMTAKKENTAIIHN